MKKILYLILVFVCCPSFLFAQANAVPVVVTATNTPAATMTATETRPVLTSTPTVVTTPTMTSTNTPTVTGTIQPFTATSTMTHTPTNSATRTFTSTATSTPTLTSTPGVFQFSVSPELDANGKIQFGWGSTIRSDEVSIKVYTSGFRLVRAFAFDKKEHPENLEAGLHDLTWDGKDEGGHPMPTGNYFCFININAGKKTYEASGRTNIP